VQGLQTTVPVLIRVSQGFLIHTAKGPYGKCHVVIADSLLQKLCETSKSSKIIAAYNKCKVQDLPIIYIFSLPEKGCSKNVCKKSV